MRVVLANTMIVIHVLWIALLVGGPWVVVRAPTYRPYYTFAVAVTVIGQLSCGLGCPLVAIEMALRGKPQHGSFLSYVLYRWLGVSVPAWAFFVLLCGALLFSVYLMTNRMLWWARP